MVDAFAGADPAHRISVRVITDAAVPRAVREDDVHRADRGGARGLRAARRSSCTRRRSRPTPTRTARARGTFVVLHPSRTEVLIGGTFYAGEIKKSIFTVMNDRLPLEGVFPMHCSANVDDDGRVAIFFGLSGTGKTTLSADPGALADRRRRARLGRQRRLQLRGRLLREGDPPLAGGRAGDLPDDAHVRDDPRERRRRRERRARPRRRLEDREHARRLQARADRERAARRSGPAIRARWSCSPPTRSGSCRRSRG